MKKRKRFAAPLVLSLLLVAGVFALILWIGATRTAAPVPEAYSQSALQALQAGAEAEREKRLRAALAAAPEGAAIDVKADCFGAMSVWSSPINKPVLLLSESILRHWGEIHAGGLKKVSEWIDPVREADQMGPVDDVLDPAAHSVAEIRANLYTLLSEAESLRRFEQAMACGACLHAGKEISWRLRIGINLLATRGILAVEQERLDEAYGILRTLLAGAQGLNYGQEYVQMQERLREAAFPLFWALLNADALSPGQQAEVQTMMRPAATPEDLKRAMRLWLAGRRMEPGVAQALALQITSRIIGNNVAHQLEAWSRAALFAGELEALLDRPPHETQAQWKALLAASDQLLRRSYYFGQTWNIYVNHWWNKFYGEVPGVVFALEKYRGETGSYPDTLEALAPRWLASVPIQPYNGEPMEFVRTDKGFELYRAHSMGPLRPQKTTRTLIWRSHR